LRRFLLVLFLTVCTCSCTFDDTPVSTVFRTDGTAKLQVCKGLIIEKCDYEPKNIPELIDSRDSYWASLRSEKKSSTLTMCYMDQPRGVIKKRKLMFKCEPVIDQLTVIDIADAPALPENLVQSLTNLAEAAAIFDICADDAGPYVEISSRWTALSSALGDVVGRMATHYPDVKLQVEYEMRRLQFYESEQFKSKSLRNMEYCNLESSKAADQFVREAQAINAPGNVR